MNPPASLPAMRHPVLPKPAQVVRFQRRSPASKAKAAAASSLGRGDTEETSLQTYVGDLVLGPRNQALLEKLRGVSVLDGDLILENTLHKDLSPLKDLQLVTGRVIIRNNPKLKDVSALLAHPGRNKLEVQGIFVAENNGVAPNAFRLHAHGDVVIKTVSDLLKFARTR
jgi:hypothetical protein